MKLIITITIGIIIFASSCSGQNVSYSEIPPFEIERDNMFMTFSPRMDKYQSGFILVTLSVNKKGKKDGFVIRKAVFKDNTGAEVINYINVNEEKIAKISYPDDVQDFYHLIVKYIKDLQIKPVPNTKPQKINNITFMIRFKHSEGN